VTWSGLTCDGLIDYELINALTSHYITSDIARGGVVSSDHTARRRLSPDVFRLRYVAEMADLTHAAGRAAGRTDVLVDYSHRSPARLRDVVQSEDAAEDY
jgi:hypothetical protein